MTVRLRESLSSPNLANASIEVFQILQSFDYTVMLYDDENNRVQEPDKARRMFVRPDNLLVTISDDGEDSTIKLIIGKTTRAADVLSLITALRTSATKFNLLFNVRQSGKSITPKDLAQEGAAHKHKDHTAMHVFEGMYGTSKSSYLRLENARMIVRHSARIDDSKMGARARCVESIFVENAQGERFLFPTKHMAPARAMTQHVNNNGSFADLVGQQITRMAGDYSALATCSNHVRSNAMSMNEGAEALREKCRCKMRKMRKTFETLYRPSGYVTEAARIEAKASTLNEGEGEQGASPEKLDELRAILAVEGREPLSDAVLEGIEHGLREDDDEGDTDTLTEPAAVAPAKRKGPYVPKAKPPTTSVFGIPVDEAAWKALTTGSIDMKGEPDIAPKLAYADPASELLFKFDAVIAKVRDASLANLLTRIADKMPNEQDKKRKMVMLAVAKATLRAAGVSVGPEAPANTPAVREFAEWIGRHGVEALAEEDVASAEGSDEEEMVEEGFPMEGEDEHMLTREDILLPPDNQGLSLKREIRPERGIDGERQLDGVDDEAEEDVDIERIRTLSGLGPSGVVF